MSRPEKAIRAQIERALQGSVSGVPRYPEIWLLSNPSGVAKFDRFEGADKLDVKTAPVQFGLGGPGGPDLILVVRVRFPGCAPLALILGIEVKSATGTRSPDQIRWHKRGASRSIPLLEEARSAEQVVQWYETWRAGLLAVGAEFLPPDFSKLT